MTSRVPVNAVLPVPRRSTPGLVLGSTPKDASRNVLCDKTAVVAGATGALGRAACIELLRHGATVVGVAREPAKIASHLHGPAFGDRFSALALSGVTEDSWRDGLGRARDVLGKIDVFVHAIGLLVPGALVEVATSDIEAIVAANLLSVVSAARTIGVQMLERGAGHFIVLGSLGGMVPMPFQSIYAATKFAVRGFCLSLHDEFRPRGVFVSLVAPGPVRSPMLDREATDPRAALTFAARPATPERIAKHIIRIIRRPRREVVVPGASRYAIAALNLLPGLSGVVLPALQQLGRRRLRAYLPAGRNA